MTIKRFYNKTDAHKNDALDTFPKRIGRYRAIKPKEKDKGAGHDTATVGNNPTFSYKKRASTVGTNVFYDYETGTVVTHIDRKGGSYANNESFKSSYAERVPRGPDRVMTEVIKEFKPPAENLAVACILDASNTRTTLIVWPHENMGFTLVQLDHNTDTVRRSQSFDDRKKIMLRYNDHCRGILWQKVET